MFARLKLMTVYNQFTLDSLNYVKTDLNVAFGQGAKFMDTCNLYRNWCFPSEAVGLFNGLPDKVKVFFTLWFGLPAFESRPYRVRITK